MLHGDKDNQHFAAKLRRDLSLPEVLLWTELRKRPGRLKFRRQHPAGRGYVLDFFCARKKLAVEVDGEAHNRGDRPARDAARDAWVASQGVRTLRIAATAVLTDLDAVIRHILAEAGIEQVAIESSIIPPPEGEVARAARRGGSSPRTPRIIVGNYPSTTAYGGGPPPPPGEE